jgi:hypothetical protein
VHIGVQKGISYTIKLSPLTLPLFRLRRREGGGRIKKEILSQLFNKI